MNKRDLHNSKYNLLHTLYDIDKKTDLKLKRKFIYI